MILLHLIIYIGTLAVQVLEYGDRFELGEVRDMKSIIGQSDFQQPVALLMSHPEKVHRRIVHTHHQLYLLGLNGIQKIAMHRRNSTEHALTKIKIVTWEIVIKIRIKTQETAQAHQKDKMETGKTTGLAIKPLKAIDDIVEQRLVALL